MNNWSLPQRTDNELYYGLNFKELIKKKFLRSLNSIYFHKKYTSPRMPNCLHTYDLRLSETTKVDLITTTVVIQKKMTASYTYWMITLTLTGWLPIILFKYLYPSKSLLTQREIFKMDKAITETLLAN